MKQGCHHTAQKEFEIDIAALQFTPSQILQSQRSDLNYLNFTLNQNSHLISSTQKHHPLQTESNTYYDKNVLLHKKLKTLQNNVNIWQQKIKLKDSQIVNYAQAIKKKRQMKKLYQNELKRSKTIELELQEKHNWAINKVQAKRQELSKEQQLIQQQIQQIKQIINKISELEKQYIRTQKEIQSTSEKYQLKSELKNSQQQQKNKIRQLKNTIDIEKKKQKVHQKSMEELARSVNAEIRRVNLQLQNNNRLKEKIKQLSKLSIIQSQQKLQQQIEDRNEAVKKMEIQMGYYYQKLVLANQRSSQMQIITQNKIKIVEKLREQLFQLKKRSSPSRNSFKAKYNKPFKLQAPPTPKKNYISPKPLNQQQTHNISKQSSRLSQQVGSSVPQYADCRFDTFNNYYLTKQDTKRPTAQDIPNQNYYYHSVNLRHPSSQNYQDIKQQYAQRRSVQNGRNQIRIQNRESYQYQIIESDQDENNGQGRAMYHTSQNTQRMNNKAGSITFSQQKTYNNQLEKKKPGQIKSSRKTYDGIKQHIGQMKNSEAKSYRTKINKNSSLQLKQLIDRYENYKKYSILENN